MITVACYAVYRGADPKLARFFRQEALRNATLAIGIDIMFYRKSSCNSKRSLKSLLASVRESYRDLAWYIQMLFGGHFILPVPTLISILSFWIKPPAEARPPHDTVAALYSASWPDAATADEIMATYLRFVATPEETYGLKAYDFDFIRMLKRWNIYTRISELIFDFFKPTLYLATYSGYLHHHTPCKAAIGHSIPTLVLGCEDCLYRISDYKVPRQFSFIQHRQIELSQDFLELSATGREVFAKRVEGAYDPRISYMKISAYEPPEAQAFWAFPSVKKHLQEITADSLSHCKPTGFITVFMHEFNDWHHNGVLPSFATSYYDWLLKTLSFTHSRRLPYVLKIHPCIVNSPGVYSDTIESLKGLATQLGVRLHITTSLTTIQLIDAGMKLAVTVRGTVALELAYLQTPFLCAGTPPYAGLFPNRIETDQAVYEQRLLNFAQELPVSRDEADLAAYYVALQERSAERPVFDLRTSSPKLADNQSYARVKTLL